ncbi:aldehyde dehydrogenase family 1 member A3-like protein [Suillus discolor]|uniref:aldehyde dehydrogenase (NAD(+)) n=1 Tax=Suillus discolor TaxID=1912936 RepID=A0A9P7ETT2_9AGAM|nr:aldehyde dehydrogenase family 1 member A3-like protein [Suillus discolor]KAG2087915.1 aldehyde dehydrogenase family 1 member A3-like protein [Suillus discolor]
MNNPSQLGNPESRSVPPLDIETPNDTNTTERRGRPRGKICRLLGKVKNGVVKKISCSKFNDSRSRDPVQAQDTSAVVQQGADPQSVNKALQDAGHGADQMNQIWGRARPVLSAGKNGPAALDNIDSIGTTYLQPLKIFDTVIGTIAEVHPYAKMALGVLSCASKMIFAQADRHEATLDLYKELGQVYGFIMQDDMLLMRDILGQISQQTLDRHEPIGVVGQIILWNFPLLMMAWKIGPALACGNTVVLKPSEFTPLTTIRMCHLINEAGFPPGVVNVITGYGNTTGNAISSHMRIEKVAFAGSTLVGRKIMEAAARSNLKNVTLELGGKSPNIIFDDADIEQAVCIRHLIRVSSCKKASMSHDEFFKRFTQSLKIGDPFAPDTFQGPQVSEIQFNRIMSYNESGKAAGAKVEIGGERHGSEGYFIKPTIFTNVDPSMKIVQEDIFSPANDTLYGLAAAVFTQDLNRALNTAHRLKAGTAWINCVDSINSSVPFGGIKQSGIGRECGDYALTNYTAVKTVHVNLGHKM